jgi:hypothetical protein
LEIIIFDDTTPLWEDDQPSAIMELIRLLLIMDEIVLEYQ